MQHWYAYHSEKTMGYPYVPGDRPSMYLSRVPSKLFFGDVIWVINGDLQKPAHFTLADCFEYKKAEHPPFPPSYSRFAIRLLGDKSRLRQPIALTRADAWFFELHGRFITKQRFFNPLLSEPAIVQGLRRVSGVTF